VSDPGTLAKVDSELSSAAGIVGGHPPLGDVDVAALGFDVEHVAVVAVLVVEHGLEPVHRRRSRSGTAGGLLSPSARGHPVPVVEVHDHVGVVHVPGSSRLRPSAAHLYHQIVAPSEVLEGVSAGAVRLQARSQDARRDGRAAPDDVHVVAVLVRVFVDALGSVVDQVQVLERIVLLRNLEYDGVLAFDGFAVVVHSDQLALPEEVTERVEVMIAGGVPAQLPRLGGVEAHAGPLVVGIGVAHHAR